MYPISFFWSNLFQNFYFPLNWEEFFIFQPILKPKEEVFQFVNLWIFRTKLCFKILSPLRFQMKRKISWVMVSSVPVNMVFWIFQKTFLKKNSCSWNLVPLIFELTKLWLQGTLPPEYDKNGLLVSETVSVATFGSRNQWNASKIYRELKKQNPREEVRSPFFGQTFSKIFIFLWTGRNSSFFSPFWSPRKRFSNL